MATVSSRHPAGVIHIDGKPFFLAKDGVIPSWRRMPIPTQEGDPTKNRRRRINDWSRGLGDSRGIFPGSLEYSEYCWTGSIGRLLPGPKTFDIASNLGSAAKTFVDVTAPAARLLAGGGVRVSEITTAHAVGATQIFGAGDVLDMSLFIDQVAVALGDTVAFQRRSAAGAYSANTLTGNKAFARAFGVSGKGDPAVNTGLRRGRDAYWSKCAAADFYATDANWGTEYDIGDLAHKIHQVLVHEGADYVLKSEGLYTFDENSGEHNVLTDMLDWASAENRTTGTWGNLLFVCTLAGLYRFLSTGVARTVGIEEVEMNEGDLANAYPTWFRAFGKWAYCAYYNGTTTWICMLRRAKEGDASFGSPFTLVGIIDKMTGESRAAHISAFTGNPHLYYGAYDGVNHVVRYFRLTRDGTPYEYRDTGTAMAELSPMDFGSPLTMKSFRMAEFIGRNVSATQTVQWAASMDGGAYNNVGAAVTVLTASRGRTFWTRGTNDQGYVMQLKVSTLPRSTAAPPEIRDVFVDYEERPDVVPGAIATFRFRDFDAEGDVSTRLTARDQRLLLEGHLDGPMVEIVDAYGDTYAARISEAQGGASYWRGGEEPQEMMQVSIRRIDYSA